MNWEPFLTCAVTGAGDTFGKHPDLPVTASEIAEAAMEAAAAGAAIVHIHVREPSTGRGAAGRSTSGRSSSGSTMRRPTSWSTSRRVWGAISSLGPTV